MLGKILKDLVHTPINLQTSRLEELKDLTEKLPNLKELIKAEYPNKVVYRVNGIGECTGENIFNDGDVAIQKAHMQKGTTFPFHAHEREVEIIIVFIGEIQVMYANGFNTKVSPDSASNIVIFIPEVEHQITALTDAWMVGITVPAEKGYPGYGGN